MYIPLLLFLCIFFIFLFSCLYTYLNFNRQLRNLKIGQTYIKRNENPFDLENFAVVRDIRKDYVLYDLKKDYTNLVNKKNYFLKHYELYLEKGE